MALDWDKIQGRISSTTQKNNTYQSTIDWDKVQGRTNNTISKSIDSSNNNGQDNIVPLNTKAYTNNTSKLKVGNITLPSSLTNTSSTVKNNLRNNLEEKAKKNNQDIVSTLLKEKKEKEAKALEEARIKKAQDELNARETVQKLNKNLGAMNSLNDIKGGSRIERTLAEREMKRKAGIYVPNEPLVTPVGLAEAGSSPIELVNAGRMAETELNKTINEQKENNNYENYMGEEYSKLNQYKNNYNEAMKGTDINELARTNALMSNAEFGKEVVDLSKYYDAWTSQANYIAGNLGIRYNEAMAKYFETQNIADLNEAKRIEELMALYNQKAENVGKGGIIRKDFANYAPQLVGQTVEGVKGAAMGASAGALTGAAVGSVVPGAGTMAGATTGAVWGARGGYVAGVGNFSYTQMIGSAYSQLLDLGIPNDIAKEVASDTALWQSVIEMTGSVIDLASLGLGSKAVKGVAGKTVGQLTAKKLIVEALKAYGINLASETAEEAIQEKIAIEGEKIAFAKAGMQRTTTEQEDLQRIIEAGAGGFTIALVSGGGNVIGSITTTALNSNTKMKVNKIYNEQINIIKDSNLTEAQKQSKIIELEDGRKNTINAIDKQIQETEGQKKVDLKNVAPEVNTIQMANKNNEIINLQKNSNIIQNASINEKISQNNIQQSLGTQQVRNTEVTQEIQTFVDNRNKISPGLSVEMDNTLNTDGVIEKRADGTRVMKINPDSSRAYEFVAVHEMLHDLEGTQEYQELSNFVKERATTQEEFEEAKKSITEQYTKYYQENGLDVSGLNMDVETTNDMTAKALGNQDFLNELAGNKPNVFMRLYNWIKNVAFDGNKTGKTFAERNADNKYLQELKKKFETAYNTAYKSSSGQQFDIITIQDNKRYAKSTRQVIKGNDASKWGEQVEKYINEEIRKGQDVSFYGADGELLTITTDTAGKAKFRNEVTMADGTKRKLTDDEYKAKLEAETHIDELAQISKHKNGPVPDTKNHSFAKDGFNYRTAYFEDSDGKYYKITMSVGKNGEINTIYNVGQMKDAQKNRSNTSNRGLNGPSDKIANGSITSNNSITPQSKTVKNSTQSSFSLKNEDDWQSYLDKNWDLMPDSKKTFGSTTLEEMQENSLDSDNKSGATATTKKYEVSKINSFMDKVLAKMETTRFGNTKELKNITKAIVKDIKNNTLTNEKAKQYLNVIYDAAIRIDSQFYEENKAIKDTIRNTKLYVSPETRSGMTDWQDFRKSNFGILSLSEDKNNLDVDTFYKELSSERADLFPKTITNQIDQLERISEVAKSIRKIEQKASEYLENNYGKEIREATIEEMQKDMNELVQEINQVQKVEAENLKKMTEKSELLETGKNLTVEQIKELQKENTKLKREYEKALRKELLTERDKLQLDRLVKGEITLDEINGQSNREAIKRLYEFKKPLEDNNNKILQAKKAKKAVRFAMAEEAVKNSGTWKDKKLLGGLRYSTETAERIIYDIVQNEAEAKNVIDTYFTPVHEHEAQATRKKNEIVDRIKKLNISAKESYEVSESIREKINKQLPKGEVYKETKLSESSLVQLLGEKIIDTKDIQELGADVSKIENATNVFRKVYNELFELSNDALIANGYPPVEYRKDYFPHFTEEKPDTVVKKILSKFGVETSNQELSTDLAGLTHTFKPGKKWVGNFLERKSTITDYNALKGLDTYLEPVMDVIYHTDDIQNLRALEDTIRYKYSEKGIQEQIDNTRDRLDLDDIQKNAILNDLYNTDTTDFSHFVTWLRGYTDSLSGKKSIEDRNMEHKLGRAAYNTMKNVEGKVASNMIGANINSALTNFIPLAQGWGEVSTGSMAKAMWDTARNASKSDNFVESSDFLINRRGNDRLYKDWKINLSEKAGKPMSVIDEFTSETLVRAKYYDNIKSGMTQEDAMANANTFAASVMGDRSKGAMPTIFNEKNPITKTFTMFQLEVNNQYRYWLKDLPRNVRDEVGNSLAKALFKIFLGSWLYGEIKEKLTGTRSVTDPIDMVADTFKDVLDEDVGVGQTIMNLGNRIVDELPFISTLTGGGRIPISAASPDLENTIKATMGLATGEMDTGKATAILLKELSKPAYYLLLPTAGGQIKKIIEGISTVANGGEYGIDSEGNKTLKFPVDTKNMSTLEKVGTYAKAAIFGKYSLPTARDYINNGNKQLSAKETQGYEEAIKKGITAKQYLDINQQIGKIKKDNGEKFVTNERRTKIINIIESQDLTKEQKEYLYKVFCKNEI